MARIYMARERISDHRFDYTVGSDEEKWVHPVGYCAGWHEWTEEGAARIGFSLESCLKDQAKLLPFKAKYHTAGHSTREEASTCWNEYRLDHDLILDGETPDQQSKCAECGTWTTKYAQLRGEFSGRPVPLCDAHLTREVFVAHSKKTSHDLDI